MPKPKPYTLEQFQEKADLYIKGALGGFPKDEMINKLQLELDKAEESGILSREEAIKFLNDRTQQIKEFIQNNPGEADLDRVKKAIGGGVIEGEDLGTREGFDAPRQITVDDNALVAEWRNSLKTKKDPVPWRTFLRNKFDEKTADAIKARVRLDEDIDLKPTEEFETIKKSKLDTRLDKITKLVKEHNDSDRLLYTAQDIFKKLNVSNLTRKDYPEEYVELDKLDKPEDKVKKAFDKIITEDLEIRAPNLRESKQLKDSNAIFQMISDMVSPKGKEISKRYAVQSRFIKRVLNTHEPYLNIKDDFDYFARNAKTYIGQKFNEAFELAKFRRGGLDIKNLKEFNGNYAKPDQNIYNFAIRHAYLNFKRDTPSQIQFFKINKKGEKVGEPLNFNDLPRNPTTLARVMNTDKYGFEYENKFFTKKNLKAGEGIKSGLFDEVYALTNKGAMLVPDPNDPGKEITLRRLLNDTGDKLTIGHNDAEGGVAGEPFKNLRLEGGKFNVAMFNAYNSVKDPKAREMIVKNLIGKFPNATKDPIGYEKAFIASKSQLAKDIFDSPEAVLELPTYYKGAAQKVLADTGKDFFSESDAFKKEIARVANIDLQEYEANKSKFKKNLVLQLARANNLPPERVEEDLTNVQKVIRKMQGQMNSGIDPKLLVEYLGAEMKDIAAFGQKYGGDVLGKVGKGLIGVDLPIFQTIFASMYDIEQDSPLWLTIPAAFTDEASRVFNLYNKSEGRFGLGKAKDFGKFLASSLVPQKFLGKAIRNPLFKAVSKVGKAGTLAGPLLEAGAGAYRFEKMKDRRDDAIRQFDIPIEIANKGFRDYIRSTVPQDAFDELNVPESPGLPGVKRGIAQLASLVGLADDPYAIQKVRGDVTGTGLTSPMALQRLYDRQDLVKGGPPDPTKRTFLKLLGLIPAGIAGLASLRFRPKKIKNIVTKIEKLKNTKTFMPDWFPSFVDKFRKEGKAENMFKKKKVAVTEQEYNQALAEGKGQDYFVDPRTPEYIANNPDHSLYNKLVETDELVGTTYTNDKFPGVEIDDFDGEVQVNWENDYSQPVNIVYVKPGAKGPEMGRPDKFQAGIEKQEFKPKGEFSALDQEVYATDPDGGYDTNAVIVDSLDDMMEGTTRMMEEYATGKPVKKLSKGEGKVIEAEIRAEQAAEAAAEAADELD